MKKQMSIGLRSVYYILAVVASGLLMVLSLGLGVAASPKLTDFSNLNVICFTCPSGTPALVVDQNSPNGSTSVAEFRYGGVPVASIGANGVDSLGSRAVYMRLQDVKDDTGGNVYNAGVVSATTTITTGITSPDYPRNLQLSYQTTTTATAGSLTVFGVDARGNSTSEVLAITAISGTQTITGSTPFATISKFTLPIRTHAVTFTVSVGAGMGIGQAPIVTGTVFLVTVNNAVTTSYTVNITKGLVTLSNGLSANDDFTIGYRQ